jgi:ribonuclease P protein component
LRSSKDFERVYALKCKAADGVLLMFLARNDQQLHRIGLSVSKKHGGAVVRNRLKRWLREAFRLERHQVPVGFDLIVIPLAAEKASLAAYRQSLVGLFKRLAKRIERINQPAEPKS